MVSATYITFIVGALFQWSAAAAALVYLMGPSNPRPLRFSIWLATAGLLAFIAVFVLRFAHWGIVPLASGADSLLLFAIMATITAISISCQTRFRALLTFYLPPVAILVALCAALAVKDFAVGPKPIEVSQGLLAVHVGMAFQAYANFFIASLTSLVYVFQSRRLKARTTSDLFQKLPSLENLDRTLYLLILVGYPLFVITLLMGLGWARFVADTLSPTWWFSPKIALSFVMVLFYAASFHCRSMGLLRGPKLAYFVFWGFGLLLGVYLLLELLRLTNYNFLGAGSV